jgi:hypothetical protein
MSGPYESEREARQAAFAIVPPEPDWTILRSGQNRELLRSALRQAGVETSEFEDRVASGLGHHEDFACSVIARWIRDANGGKPAPGAVTLPMDREHDGFVLITALEDFRDRQRHEAEWSNAGHRNEWADSAERMRAIAAGEQATTEGEAE